MTVLENTVELPVTDILCNEHLTTQDKMLQSGLNKHYNTSHLSKMQTSRYSIKRTDFAVPLIPAWTVQNPLDNADTGRCLAQNCLTPLIDIPTGHYTNTGMHSSSLWLSFLAIIQQGRALERAFVAFNGTSTHCHIYRKYTRNLQSRDTSILRTL